MEITAIWSIVKTLGPWLALVLVVAAIGVLVVDRNHLATLNNQHQACLASVQGAAAAKPLDQACEPPIAAAAEAAAAADACNHALATGDAFAASQACAGPTKSLIADRDSKAAEAANLSSQLASASADRDAAVSRATARASASQQELIHAQSVLAAAPRDGSGASMCDADCLRQLVQPAQDPGQPAGQ